MPTTSDRPNILLLFTDQHRLSALGCYGETPCRTPHLDGLARDGVRFETCYTSCPVCSPARATIMTGQHIHAHGVCSNVHNLGNTVHEIPDGPHLLSRRLQAAGYRCGYTGKWHLGAGGRRHNRQYEAALPTNRGFEGQDFPGHGGGGFRYPEYRDYLTAHGWDHRVLPPDRPTALNHCGILDEPLEATVPYFLASNTIELIDRFDDGQAPFFIWHNNWGPHGPYFATEPYYAHYRDTDIPPWPNADWPAASINRPHRFKLHPQSESLPWEAWAETIRYYYAFTSMIDDQIGRVLEHLDRRGLAQNTVVVFTSDHGETLGSHGGLIDKGWHHFEEIQRIGMIVEDPRGFGPRGRRQGSVAKEWASLLDVYPTVLELAGAEPPGPHVHGQPLLPLLRGEDVSWRDTAVVEFNGVNSISATLLTCRWGELKYGWNAGNEEELYDLAADPYEMSDVSGDPRYASRLDAMRERLHGFCRETRHPAAQFMQR